MWFMEMKYGNNCTLGLHFYNRQGMYDWISAYFKAYTFIDNFTDLRIWYEEEKDGDY